MAKFLGSTQLQAALVMAHMPNGTVCPFCPLCQLLLSSTLWCVALKGADNLQLAVSCERVDKDQHFLKNDEWRIEGFVIIEVFWIFLNIWLLL